MRTALVSMIVGAGLSGSVQAATVASFSAGAFAGIGVISAVYEDTGDSALGDLKLRYWADGGDWGGYYEEGTNFTPWDGGAGGKGFALEQSVRMHGSTSSPDKTPGGAIAEYRMPGLFYYPKDDCSDPYCDDDCLDEYCDDVPNVTITYEYYFAVEAMASVTSGRGIGDAGGGVDLQASHGIVGFDFWRFVESQVDNLSAGAGASSGQPGQDREFTLRSGIRTLTLRPYQGLGLDFYVVGMSGGASVTAAPAPVPLPATLPMLGVALLGLLGVARRAA